MASLPLLVLQCCSSAIIYIPDGSRHRCWLPLSMTTYFSLSLSFRSDMPSPCMSKIRLWPEAGFQKLPARPQHYMPLFGDPDGNPALVLAAMTWSTRVLAAPTAGAFLAKPIKDGKGVKCHFLAWNAVACKKVAWNVFAIRWFWPEGVSCACGQDPCESCQGIHHQGRQ